MEKYTSRKLKKSRPNGKVSNASAPARDTQGNLGVRLAIAKMGGQKELADALDVSQPTISWYLNNRVPMRRALQIERVSGVSRKVIRPDIFEQIED